MKKTTKLGNMCKYGHTERYLSDGKCAVCRRKKQVFFSKRRRERLKQEMPYYNSFRACLVRARKKNVQFKLSKEWAASVWTGKCALSGIDFVLGKGKQCTYSPSIDRIENSIGYIPENCRFVLLGINSLKMQGSDKDVFLICKKVIELAEGPKSM